ncbi:HlyD family efflux transporter periplasmic adaptor subunit [Rhodobacter sp. NTK016B]|uniref:HlyD family efflux transporter periplasmic adaptor subunit n=1 Tax=Rhodobacter sp. NTK016B TaxID=2759676 RepID=UPI001A8CAEC6|nr:HlyD family efflux transporter periplasmic adaptor subunit [Rhodobacter sp. NTK016B]MBN8294929.1 HlyD family efflux transporter periplasmic adaptor subunit [Rhodobacter sp. NTK016B]
MSRDAFDAEEFLNLRETAGHEDDPRDLPPLVAPPVYDRARRDGVTHGAAPRPAQAMPRQPAPQARTEADLPPIAEPPQYPRAATLRSAPAQPQFQPHPVQQSGQAQARRHAAPQPAAAAPIPMFYRDAEAGRAAMPHSRAHSEPLVQAQGTAHGQASEAGRAMPSHMPSHWAQPADPEPRAEQHRPQARSAEVLQPEFRHAAPRYEERAPAGYRHPDERADPRYDDSGYDDPYRAAARPDYRAEYRPEYRALAPFTRREAPAVAIVVREPMVIVHRGVEHPVVEWSISGFTLDADDHLEVSGGDEGFLVTLLIGDGETRVQMRVRVASEEPELEHPTRFVFVDLDAARADVLEKIVDHVVATQSKSRERQPAQPRSTAARTAPAPTTAAEPQHAPVPPRAERQSAPVDDAFDSEVYGADADTFRAQALTEAAPPVAAPQPKKAEKKAPKAEAAPKPASETPARGRRIRIGAKLPLAVLLLITGSVTYGIATSVTSRYAAVTVAAIDANAPIDGVFRESLVAPGDRVTPDQILGYITPPAREYPLGAAESTGAYSDAMRARIDTLLQSSVEPMQAVIPVPGVDPLPENTESADMAPLTVAPPAASVLPPREAAAPAGVPIYASCDCVVQQVSLQAGDAVEPGTRAFVLAGAEAPNVQALLPAAQAAEVAVGDRVMTRIGNEAAGFGRIEQIVAATDTLGRAGLEADVFGSSHYRRIEIAPDTPIAAAAGTPVHVTVQTFGPWGWARETFDPVLGGALGLFGW